MDDIPSAEVNPGSVVHRLAASSTAHRAPVAARAALSTGVGAPSTGSRVLAHSVVQGCVVAGHEPLLMRTIRSLTWSKICRRSFMSEEILSTACMTVVWSRPPNSLAMAGNE